MNVAVIGVSDKVDRYSNICVKELIRYHHTVYPFGVKKFIIQGIEVITEKRIIPELDTITLYISPARQPEWYDFILSCKPKRLIFNPGTFNAELKEMAENSGIKVVENCTLFMLSTGEFEQI